MRILLLAALLAVMPGQTGHLQYVNPFVGTDAHGHTVPGAGSPGFIFIDEIWVN